MQNSRKGGVSIMTKNNYQEPEMKIRKYSLPVSEYITTSDMKSDDDIGDGDDHGNIFG